MRSAVPELCSSDTVMGQIRHSVQERLEDAPESRNLGL